MGKKLFFSIFIVGFVTILFGIHQESLAALPACPSYGTNFYNCYPDTATCPADTFEDPTHGCEVGKKCCNPNLPTATPVATQPPSLNCGTEGQICCNSFDIDNAYCNSGLSCLTRQGQSPICCLPSGGGLCASASPTPTSACGSTVGATCCQASGSTRPCLISSNLYCLSNVCQSITAKAATVADWSAAFNTLNLALDFNNDNTSNGADYALWLKAGHTL